MIREVNQKSFIEQYPFRDLTVALLVLDVFPSNGLSYDNIGHGALEEEAVCQWFRICAFLASSDRFFGQRRGMVPISVSSAPYGVNVHLAHAEHRDKGDPTRNGGG